MVHCAVFLFLIDREIPSDFQDISGGLKNGDVSVVDSSMVGHLNKEKDLIVEFSRGGVLFESDEKIDKTDRKNPIRNIIDDIFDSKTQVNPFSNDKVS